MKLEQLIQKMGAASEKADEMWGKEENPDALRKSLATFSERYLFTPGDIIEWKPGMRNRKSVGPFIVVEMLDQPVTGDHESGTSLFREPMDIIVGRHDPDGDFVCFHMDSRRFQPYKA